MLYQYAKCLEKLFGSGLQPVLTRFHGMLYHGTTNEIAAKIVESQEWIFGEWSRSWFGPAAYFFEDCAPYPCWDDSAGGGARAAIEIAELKIELGLQAGNPAIVVSEVACTRVLDLESIENDEFVNKALQCFRAQPAPSEEIRLEMERPAFVGKVLHWHLNRLPEALRPQAFQISFPLSYNRGMQRGLAIIDKSAIHDIRIG